MTDLYRQPGLPLPASVMEEHMLLSRPPFLALLVLPQLEQLMRRNEQMFMSKCSLSVPNSKGTSEIEIPRKILVKHSE
jgi:hypothetical protein